MWSDVKSFNMSYAKAYGLWCGLNQSKIIQMIDDSWEETLLPTYKFATVQEVDGQPTIATQYDNTWHECFEAYSYNDQWERYRMNQTVKWKFNGDMTDVEKYVFVAPSTQTQIVIRHNSHENKYGIMYLNTGNKIHDYPTVYGLKNGVVSRIQGSFERVGTNIADRMYRYWWSSNTEWTDLEVGLTSYTLFCDAQCGMTLNPNNVMQTQMKLGLSGKMASSEASARRYLLEDDESGLIDGEEEEVISERNITTLYLESKVYRSATSTRTSPTLVESKKWEFDVQRYNDDGTEKPKYNRGVFAFVNDAWTSSSGHYNLGFIKNTATNNLVKVRVNGIEVDKDSFSWVTGLTTYVENTKETVQDGTFYYYSKINTNMYIFDTLEHAQQAISSIGADLEGITKKFVGDSIDPMTLQNNELNFDTDMSDTFILNNADVKALATRFNAYVSTDGTIISDLFVGLAMHQNPIDCSIDLFSMPIALTDFVDVESYTVKFSPTVSNNEESN